MSFIALLDKKNRHEVGSPEIARYPHIYVSIHLKIHESSSGDIFGRSGTELYDSCLLLISQMKGGTSIVGVCSELPPDNDVRRWHDITGPVGNVTELGCDRTKARMYVVRPLKTCHWDH